MLDVGGAGSKILSLGGYDKLVLRNKELKFARYYFFGSFFSYSIFFLSEFSREYKFLLHLLKSIVSPNDRPTAMPVNEAMQKSAYSSAMILEVVLPVE